MGKANDGDTGYGWLFIMFVFIFVWTCEIDSRTERIEATVDKIERTLNNKCK